MHLLVASLVLFITWLVSLPTVWWVHERLGWQRLNFRKESIPCSLGLVPWLLGSIALIFYRPFDSIWLMVLGFGVLGFLDDRWGQNSPKGLRGHLYVVRHGRLTPGLLKLIGGLILAFFISWQQVDSELSPFGVGLGTLLIALAANFFNLMDLRPGRAASMFLVVALVPLILSLFPFSFPLSPAVWIYLGVLRILLTDRRGEGMMGDMGSNLIGAMLGVLMLKTVPLWVQGILVVALLAFHLWAEQVSFSDWIERHPWVRRIDRWTGIRF